MITVPLVFGETGATRAIKSPRCISVVATRFEGLACRLVSLGPPYKFCPRPRALTGVVPCQEGRRSSRVSVPFHAG